MVKKKPDLSPEIAAEFELHGVDAVRAFLVGQGSYKGEGTTRDTPYRLGATKMTRGEVEDWLKWKNATESRWVKIGAWAAIIGAFAAIAAAILAFLSWLVPIK